MIQVKNLTLPPLLKDFKTSLLLEEMFDKLLLA